MKQLYLRLLATVGILFGSVHVEAQYSSIAQLSAGSDISLACNVNCFTLQSSLTDVKATTTYTIDSSLSYAGNYGFNIVGATQIASVDEIFSGAVTLPFNFCFFGTDYLQLTIGTNGAINFGSTNAYQLNYGLITNGIPSADYPNATIMPAMQDLDITAGGAIKYSVSGNYPNRKFIINYYQVPQKTCLSQTVTMQVVLYETTNVIEYYIKDKPVCGTQNGGNAISGIQENASSAIALPGKNNTNWGSNNMNKAYRFIPNGSSSVSSVKLKDLSGNILAAVAATPSTQGQLSANFANVCLTNNSETYVVSATYYNCNGDSTVLADTMTANKMVVPLPVPQGPVYYCQGATPVALTATGTNLLWYTTLTGGLGSSTMIPSTIAAGTYKYYVSQTVSGCESLRDSVTVTVGLNGAGFVASSNSPVCQNGDIYLTAPTVPGANYVWTGPNGYYGPTQNPVLPNANFSAAGTYTVSVQSPGGCADFSATTTVAIIAGPSIWTGSQVHPTMCEGFDDGQIKLSGDFTALTAYEVFYSKNFVPQPVDTIVSQPNTQIIIPNLGGGFYSQITVRELGGCMSNEAPNIVLNSVVAPTVTITKTDPAGCGPMANGTITLNGLEPLGDYTINYEFFGVSATPILLTANNSGSLTITGLAGGTYTNITATRLGCTTNPAGPILLAIPPTPVVTPTTNAPICGGDTVKLFGASTISTVSWSWTGPNSYASTLQNPVRPNATTAYSGMYTLTATNTANYCVSEPVGIEVIVKPVPATPVATSNSPLCSGQTLNLQASGSGVGVTYNWNGPNSFTSTLQNPSITNVTTVHAGNYGVYASKDGCTSVGTATVNVSVTTTPNIASTSSTNPTTCGGSNGTIILNGLGASTTYTITFTRSGTPQAPQTLTSNGSGVLTIIGLIQGTYTNIIASSGSCSSNIMGPVVLTDPAIPAAPTASNNGPLCSGQTLNLTASSVTPGVTYSWTGPNSFSSGQQNPTINSIQTTNAGTYTVVAQINGCNSAPATTTVTVNQTPATPVATSNSPICAGSTLNLFSTTVAGTYSWTGPNGFTSNLEDPSITSATTAATGTYTVNVTQTGCTSANATVAVTVNAVPNISGTTFTNPSTCGGSQGTITLTGLVPGNTYTVNYDKNSTPATPVSITANGSGNVIITGLTQGVYSNITVTINGCISNIAAPVTLTDPAAPVITASSNSPVCEDATLNLSVTTVTGGSYSWSGPSSFSSTAQNPSIANATPAHSGTYTVIAGVNNCFDTAATTVIVNPTPATPVITTNSPVCSGNNLTLNTAAVSGGSYNWWGPNSFTSATQNNMITAATTAATGTYSLAVSVNGCISDTATASVTVFLTPNIASTSSTNPTTCGGNDGTITLNGLAPSVTFAVTYTKNGAPQTGSVTTNGSGSGTIGGLTQGLYELIQVSANGCSSNVVGPITLTDPAAPVITASNNGPVCEGDTISLSVTTVPGGTYIWSGPVSYTSSAQNPDILGATPANGGVYTVIAGLNNCFDTATTTVVVYPTPATPVITTNSPVCTGNTLTLNTTAVSGGSYNWWGPNSWTSTTQNNSIPSVTLAANGIYNLAVSVNGCISDTATATVIINETPNITSTSFTNPTTCLGADGTISLLGLNNNTAYTVNYTFNSTPQNTTLTTNGSGILTITGLSAGSYTNISVTLLGCPSNLVGPITLVDPAAPVITASNNTPICESDTVEFTVTTVIGATYTWSGPSFSSALQNPTIPGATPANNGVYTVIATVNNCSDTATTTVLVNPTPATPAASSNSPVCSGDVLNLTSGTIPGATYSWWGPNTFTSSDQNPSIPGVTIAAAGTYYVTATVTGCISDTGSTVVVVNPTPHIDSATFTNPTSCSGSDGTITLHGLTATTTYSVDYDQDGNPQTQSVPTNGSGQGTITGLPAGTYTNITASLNNCISNAVGPVILVDPNAPAPPAVANNGPLCPGDTLLLTASTVTGATYSWWGPNSFSSTQQNPEIVNVQPVHAGTYYVTMTVANCTSDTAETTVIINPTPATPVATSNSPVCTGNDINLFSSTVTGATYTWTGPNTFTSNLQNPVITNAQAIHAGDYILSVSINNCASANDTVTVTINEKPVITDTAHTDPTICGGTDGTITLMGLLNSTAYTVNFNHDGAPQTPISITSNGSGEVIMTGLSNGTYGAISVTLNGCTSDTVGMFTIYNPPPITITASNAGTICEGDTIFLFATTVAGATYQWSGPAGFSSTDQNPVITPTTVANAGTYTVTATALGCNSTDTTTVDIIATPQTPVASSNSPVCEGSDINLFATTVSGATYSWSGPNTYSSTDQNPVITGATSAMAGQYIVSVTGNGCLSGSDTVDVVINPTPVITDTAHTDPTTCNGNDGTITLEGLITGTVYDVYYELDGTNQSPATYTANGSGNVVITGLGAGTYDSIYVNLGGCISNYMGPIILVDPAAPATPVAGSNSPVCEGDTIFLTASSVPGGTYQWSGPGGYSSTDQNPVIAPATAADAGQYTVTVTVANCTSDPDTVDVIVNPTPAPPVAGSNSPICEGEDLNLTATTVPGGTYDWTGPNSWTSTDQNPVITGVTVADAGQYIVTVTSTGCTSGADTVDVVVNPTPVIADTSSTNPTTCTGTDGTITLYGLGNNTTYTVTYYQNGVLQTAILTSDGSGNVVITGLAAGTYDTISVVMSPCASLPVGPIVLVDPGAPDMPVASSNTPICEGDSILLFATAVPGGVTYTWNGPGGYTSNDQNPVIYPATAADAGTYTVTATLNNCTSGGSTTTVVINPTPAMATAGSNSPICEGDTIFLTATNVPGATYTWNGPNGWTSSDQNPFITPATAADAGTYSVTTGLGICGSDTSFTTVVINPTPAPPTAGSNSPICEGQPLNLTATTVPGATYDWSGPGGWTSTDQNPTIDPTTISDAGTYYVTATGGGCTSGIDSVIVVIDTLPDMPIAAANTPLCEGDTLYLTATTVNGATYTWNGPNGWTSTDQNPVIYNVAVSDAGQYTVFATTNGCGSGADTVDVVINPASIITGHSLTNPTVCAGTDGTITLNGFTPGVSYTITYLQNGNPITVTLTADVSGNLVITGLTAGTYANLEVASLAGCTSDPLVTVVLTDPNAPATPVAGGNSPVCEGQAIELTATGSTTGTYNWTSTTGYTSNDQNPVISPATPADAGTYYVSVTENGCTSGVDSVVIVVNPIAAPPVAGSNSPVCEGDNIELTALTTTTGVNYIWWGPNGYGSTQQNPVISPATPADAGTYFVTADLGGCNSDTASVTVVVNPTPVISGTSSTNPTVCNGTDGTITLTGLVAGTSYDITYLQNGNPVGPVAIVADVNGDVIITGLSAGSYTGLVSASGVCGDTVTSAIILTDPNAPTAPVVNNNGPLCEGDTLYLISSVPGMVYTWTGPGGFTSASQNDSILSVTTANAGIYTLVVSLNGCSAAPVTTNVVINPTPVAPVASSNSPLCEGSDLTLFATTIPGAIYTWTGPSFSSTDEDPIITAATAANSGWYYVYASFGTCGSAMDSVNVLVTPVPNPPTVVSPIVYCEGDAATALSASGVNLLWYTATTGGSGSSASPVPNTSVAGTTWYYVSQTVNGCESNRDSIEVIVNPKPLTPGVISPVNFCQGEPAGPLTATGTNLLWYTSVNGTGSATPPTPNTSVIGQTVYYVSQTVGGCESDKDSIVVNVLPGAQAPAIGGPAMYCQYSPALPDISTYVVGTNLMWYTTQTGGTGSSTPPVISTSVATQYVFWVSQGNGACESARYPVTVIVTAKPNPPFTLDLSYCQNMQAPPLAAGGQNLLWYTSQTGGAGSTVAPTPQTGTTGPTTYWVSQTVNGCESDRSPLTVIVTPTPAAPVINQFYNYCQYEPTVQLTPSGGTILWYTTATGGTGIPTAPVPNTNQPGVYHWWVSVNVEGCESERAMVTVTVYPKPPAPGTTPIGYCQGQTATPLTAAGQNMVWYISATGGTGTTSTPTPLTGNAGVTTYYVSQVVNGCESDRAPLPVTIYQTITADLSFSKNKVCRKDTVSVSYTGTVVTGATYTWNFGSANIISGSGVGPYVLTWPTGGNHTVSVTVNNGICSSTKTASIEIVEAPDASFVMQNDACLGEIVKVQPDYEIMGQDGEYKWTFSGAEIVSGTGDGYYQVRWNTPGLKVVTLVVQGTFCPSQPFRDTIKIHEKPIAKIENEIHYNICSGDTVSLSAYYNTNYTYAWGPDRAVGDYNDRAVITAKIEKPMFVTVNVYDDYGCSNADSIYINSQPCCNVWLPNAFTPNGDGRNDIFRLMGDGHIELATFAVRNRFGQVVFETANQHEPWDGRFNGQMCDIGTYFYFLRYKCGDKIVEKKGDVTLIR